MSNFKAWAKDVALRAVKTAAQAAVALITANTAGLTHLDFAVVADVAAMAAFVCVLQNLSNLKVPDPAASVPLEAVLSTTGATTGYLSPGNTSSASDLGTAGTANVSFPYIPPAVAADPTVPAASS